MSEVSIHAEQGGTCRLAMPWDCAAVTLSEEGGGTHGVAVNEGAIEFACRAGGHYRIMPFDNQDKAEPTFTENS